MYDKGDQVDKFTCTDSEALLDGTTSGRLEPAPTGDIYGYNSVNLRS